VEASGQPVALCQVRVGHGKQQGGFQSHQDEEVVNGEFRRLLMAPPPYEVSVSKVRDERGRPLNLRATAIEVADVAVPVVVTLEAGGEVSGTVVDETGKPVEGARVATGDGTSSTTGADGAFRIGAIEGDEVTLQVNPPPPYVQPSPTHVRKGQTGVVVRLQPGAAIAGRVFGPDGKPWTRGHVQASWRAGEAQGNANTSYSADGRFRLEGLPGEATVDLMFQSWDDGSGKAPRAASVKGVRAGTLDVEVRLEAGVSIEGTLVDASGQPAIAGWISVQSIESDQGPQFSSGAQPQNGVFTIHGLAPGTYRLQAHSPQGLALGEGVRVVAPAKGVRLVVPKVGKLRGRVEGSFDPSRIQAMVFKAGFSAENPWAGMQQFSVAADGTFTADAALDADHFVRVSIEGDDRYGLAGPVRADGGEVVVRLRPGLILSGVIEGAKSVLVLCRNASWLSYASLDDQGRFTIRALPPGRYDLSIWTEKGTLVPVGDANAGDTDVRLRKP
jgi:hypothetical protein